MKKFLAMMLVLVMLCSLLTACGTTPKALIEKADAALQEAPYAMTLKMNFSSDNKELNDILSLMNMEVPTVVDGNNMSMKMDMDVMGVDAKIDIVVADMVLYYDMTVMGQQMKMKATMNDEQYQEFVKNNNTQMSVKPEHFAELTVENKDGKKYIACGKITEEGMKELNDMMKESMAEVGGDVKVDEVTYGVTLSDGKYESMEMSCTYTVTVEGQAFKVSFDLSAKFSYENVAKVTAPADADKYTGVDFDDLGAA